MRRQRRHDGDGRSLACGRFYLKAAPEMLHAFSGVVQAESTAFGNMKAGLGYLESEPVVFDLDPDAAAIAADGDGNRPGLRVLHHIAQ